MTEPNSGPGRNESDAAGRVAADMLHEIRNVLNPIVSAAYLLRTHASDPAKVAELAERIEGFARGEQRIVDRMRRALERERSAPAMPPNPAAGAGASRTPSSSSSTP